LHFIAVSELMLFDTELCIPTDRWRELPKLSFLREDWFRDITWAQSQMYNRLCGPEGSHTRARYRPDVLANSLGCLIQYALGMVCPRTRAYCMASEAEFVAKRGWTK